MRPDGDYANAGAVVALAPFDADGDGDVDLATANSTYSGQANRLFLNDGLGRLALAEAGAFDDLALDTRTIAAFDADGDGDVDLAVGNVGARNALYLNDGHGSFTQGEAGDFDDLSATTQSLLAFDADGDGDDDLSLVESGEYGSAVLFLNDGHGRFQMSPAGTVAAEIASAHAVLDADGDGDPDLAILAYHSVLALNDGQGRFRPTPGGAFQSQTGAAIVALDYDHDGDVDLAITRESGTRDGLLANDGSGQFVQVTAGDLETLTRDGPPLPSWMPTRTATSTWREPARCWLMKTCTPRAASPRRSSTRPGSTQPPAT